MRTLRRLGCAIIMNYAPSSALERREAQKSPFNGHRHVRARLNSLSGARGLCTASRFAIAHKRDPNGLLQRTAMRNLRRLGCAIIISDAPSSALERREAQESPFNGQRHVRARLNSLSGARGLCTASRFAIAHKRDPNGLLQRTAMRNLRRLGCAIIISDAPSSALERREAQESPFNGQRHVRARFNSLSGARGLCTASRCAIVHNRDPNGLLQRTAMRNLRRLGCASIMHYAPNSALELSEAQESSSMVSDTSERDSI